MTRGRFGFVAMLLFIGVVIPVVASSQSIVRVLGDTSAGENQPGWLFNRDLGTATPYEFNTDEASIGAGSLYVLPIGDNPSDKFIGEFFMVSPLADVLTISYDFKIGLGGSDADAVHFYMNVYANYSISPSTKFYDCRYNIVPTTGSTGGFTTVTFDPNASYSVTTSGSSPVPTPCPAIPADMGEGSTLRAFALNVGDTSTSDEELDGYLDNVVVAQVTGTVVYDFDIEPQTADDCKNGGWRDYGFRNQGLCIQFVNTGKDSR